MKFMHVKAVVGAMALSVALASAAQAQVVDADITRGTSASGNVQIGVSNVPFGPHSSDKVGISVPALGPGTFFVDFEGLQGTATPTANIVTTVNNPTGTITDHSQYGRFDLSKVDGYTVYYGEWNQSDDASLGDHTVYFGGIDATDASVVNGLTGTAVAYNVYGLSDYANNGQLNGEFTANFVANTLEGSIESATGSYKLDIGTAAISGNGFLGTGTATATNEITSTTLASGGNVSGNFFGSAAQALAGIATFTDNQYNAAFGGTQ